MLLQLIILTLIFPANWVSRMTVCMKRFDAVQKSLGDIL
jgi:hypothetical protein